MRRKLIIGLASVMTLAVVFVGAFIVVGDGFGDKPALPAVLQIANRPILISHRGASGVYPAAPENTIQSFENAQSRGYRWFELDIQNSADGRFIVFHDRTGGAELPDVGVVSEMTVAQLQEHPLVRHGKLTNYTIPTLDSLVARFDKTVLYYFDMKKYGHASIVALADDIAEFINRHGLNKNVFVASHRFAFISYLEYAHPEINTVLEAFNHRTARALDYLPRNFKPDMIAGYQVALDDSLVLYLRESGWIDRYIAFHVDSAKLEQTLNWGIQYIMVDDGPYVDSLLALQGAN